MVGVTCYMIVSYGIIGTVLLLHRKMRDRRAAWVALLLVPVLPYLWVFGLTMIFSPRLRRDIPRIDREMGGEGKVSLLRVFWVRPGSMDVYFVTCETDPPHGAIRQACAGMMVRLKSERGVWTLTDDWRPIWSDQGSQDGNTFPPFPEGM